MAVEKPPTDLDGLPLIRRSTPERWQAALPELLKSSWLLPVSGAVIYALLRVFYSRFYWKLGLQPEDVGLGYAQILEQSLVALILLILGSSVVFSVFVFIPDKYDRHLAILEVVIMIPWLLLLVVLVLLGSVPYLSAGPQVWGLLGLILFFFQFTILGSEFRSQRMRAPRTTDRRELAPLVFLLCGGLVAFVLAEAFVIDTIAADVSNGKTSHYVLFDQPLLSVGGDPATVYWPATPLPPSSPPPQTPAPYQHCLMYIGQANGSTIFYDAKNKTAIRVPSNTIIVQTHPEWRGSNCKP